MKDFYLVAKIISLVGRNGFVKILSYSKFSKNIFEIKNIFVEFFGDKKSLFIEDVRNKKKGINIKFKNFDTSEEAEILLGKEIFIDKKDLIDLPQDFYFEQDLLNSTVFCNNVKLGTIKEVLELPANNVYVVKTADNKEILIPAISDFIENFDANKKILQLRKCDEFYEGNDEN